MLQQDLRVENQQLKAKIQTLMARISELEAESTNREGHKLKYKDLGDYKEKVVDAPKKHS